MPSYSNPHSEPAVIGVIGGSGVYKLNCLTNMKHYTVDTPFGRPSGDVCVAKVNGVTCAFLPRHGEHHTVNPSEVNYRANICAMKQLGVKYLLAINAVGSLDDNYLPGDLVMVDQIVDKTTQRVSTFFEKGVVAHVDFAHPTSVQFSEVAYQALCACFPDAAVSRAKGGFALHRNGTLVTMEGPQFSTKAESLLNKQLGAHLIGMTTATEAKLAREAEIAYATVAMVTDLDAWSDAPHVDTSAVMKVLASNAAKAQLYPPAIISALSAALPMEDPAHNALQFGILTKPEHMSKEVKERLQPLLAGKYPQYAP